MATLADIELIVDGLPIYTRDTKVLNWEDKWTSITTQLKLALKDLIEYERSQDGVLDYPIGAIVGFNNGTDPNAIRNAYGYRRLPGTWMQVPYGNVLYTGATAASTPADFRVSVDPAQLLYY